MIGAPTLADLLTQQVSDGRIPEAYDIPIAAPDGVDLDGDTVRQVAALVAGRLFPDRLFGEVLWAERHDDHWHAYVRDLGPRP